MKLLLLAVLLSYSSFSFSNDTWSYIPKGKTIVIGDIHADAKGFIDILIHTGVIDKKTGKFIGKDIDIALMGDYTGKGPDTRGVWDIIDFITKEAPNHNSRVHTVFGNHDIVLFRNMLSKLKKKDLKRFRLLDPDPEIAVKKALTMEPYKSMMKKWKAMVRIGESVYTHGGIDDFIYDQSPQELNKMTQDFVTTHQEHIEKTLAGATDDLPELPKMMQLRESKKGKVLMPDHPFWTRRAVKEKINPYEFDRMLDHLGAKRVFVGHTPTESKQIEKRYNGKLILTDTHISEVNKDSRLSAVVVDERTGQFRSYNNLKRGIGKKTYSKIVSYMMRALTPCFDAFRYRD
jgi:hypothetical protein